MVGDMNENLPARVEELEIRIAFQDDLIQTLNRDVATLSLEVERLRAELARMRESVDAVRVAVSHDVTEEPPPPHY